MISLDLDKIDYKNYTKKEIEIIEPEKKRKEIEITEYRNLRQNISRSWSFLKQTHKLQYGECCCIRAVTSPLFKGDPGAKNHEFIIFNFSKEEYQEYSNFMISHISYKRVYNFYHNVFKIDISLAKETYQDKGGFFGKKDNISTTNIIALDFDDISDSEYIKMKEDLKSRGLQTLDVMSGHGYHIYFLLKENLEDESIMKKMIRIMKSLGYLADSVCFDTARVLRLPFLYNQKSKYKTAILAEIIDNEYNCPSYSIYEIFEKLGFDYNTYNLEEKQKKKAGRPKKIEKEDTYTYNENVDLEKLYDINLKHLEPGICNMLKGFRKGYANIQTMVLTLYFKNKGYSLEEIQDILHTVENVNGNWNYWNVENEVERFYNNYKYIDKFLLEELEDVFGHILINYDETYIIPVGLNPKQTKLYIYLLLNNNCKKKDILRDLNISNNKLDRIMIENKLVKLENRIYSLIENIKFDKFIKIDSRELEKLNSLNENEIAVYSYLKWKCGIKKHLKISILSIKDIIGITEHTITNTIKSLEHKNLITVKRYKFTEHVNKNGDIEFYKECNEYTIF